MQLILFAQTKFDVTDFLNENERTFSKLFVANPVDTKSGPIDPIPSPIAYLYTTDDILDQIDFTANAVSWSYDQCIDSLLYYSSCTKREPMHTQTWTTPIQYSITFPHAVIKLHTQSYMYTYNVMHVIVTWQASAWQTSAWQASAW